MRYLCVFLYCACFSCVSVLADGGKIIFPDRRKFDQVPVEPTQTFRTARSMPLDMIMKLNAITNEDEFIKQFIESDPLQSSASTTSFRKPHMVPQSGVSRRVSRLTDARHLPRDTEVETPQIALAYSLSGASPSSNNRLGNGVATSRFGGNEQTENTNEKKNTVQIPKPANCQPELRTVALKDHDDPTLFYFPSCTRADRCGGCCDHELLTCQPTAVEYKNFSVIVAQYNGGHKLEMKGRKTVTVETHTKCKCDCKIKPKDCTTLQEYKKNECRCVCTNKDEESKCSKDRMRLWNPSACTCQCREVRECSTGLNFDEITCSCVPSNKQFSPSYNIDRDGYKIGYAEQ